MAEPPAVRRPRPARRCPVCNKPAAEAHHPFCSDRCRQVDLGRWLAGDYAIPTSPLDEEEPEG